MVRGEPALVVPDQIRLFLLVCSAVEYAHAHGVVHRDLKPHNILVTRDGTPRLLDFGIAAELGAGADTGFTTAAMMTPQVASPEQIRGEAPSPSIDVYALGVLLHRLLSGGSPYRVRTGAAHRGSTPNVRTGARKAERHPRHQRRSNACRSGARSMSTALF